MTQSEVVSLIVSSAALIGLIISNVVFYLQRGEMRRQNERLSTQLRLGAEDTLRQTLEGVGRDLLSYPRLRPLFYPDEADPAGEAPLNHEDRLRAACIAEDLLDTFERRADWESDPGILLHASFRRYAQDMLTNSDFLYEYLCRRASWYSAEMLNTATKARRERPPPQTGTSTDGPDNGMTPGP